MLTIILIPTGLIAVAVIFLAILFIPVFNQPKPMTFGVTFSEPFAKWLGLDAKKAYTEILDDLQVKDLRLIAYWDEIEPQEGVYDFSSLDWQIAEAEKRGANIILAIGQKVPRWPECHYPDWTKNFKKEDFQEKILTLLRETVNRYKDKQVIKMWQVENEPLVFFFGKCPFLPDRSFLKQEISLVRGIDSRPTLVTDSGELSTWLWTSGLGDYFGTTMYRVVWNPVIGFFSYDYIFSPAFYRLKAFLNGLTPAKVIISELQAESWGENGQLATLPLEKLRKSMDSARLKKNIDFASRTGFKETYLWGAEYWYWLKEKKGDDSLWQIAKGLWNK